VEVTDVTIVAAAQMTSEELAMRYDWAMQRRQWTFAMSPGGRLLLPEDFSRIVPGTLSGVCGVSGDAGSVDGDHAVTVAFPH
jgi:hypothetical protein